MGKVADVMKDGWVPIMGATGSNSAKGCFGSTQKAFTEKCLATIDDRKSSQSASDKRLILDHMWATMLFNVFSVQAILDLPENDAETDGGGQIQRADTEAKPGERSNGLKDEAVGLNYGLQEYRHC
jgi:hypothetical protein